MTLLHSTVAGLEQDTQPGAGDSAVAELKRSVVLAIADLELQKAETEKLHSAASIASALALAGRPAYVVDPGVLRARPAADFAPEFIELPKPSSSRDPLDN